MDESDCDGPPVIVADMYVTDSKKAGDVMNGEMIDSIREGVAGLEQAAAQLLGDQVLHVCQEVTTASGAVAVVSNNALVYVDDPSRSGLGVVNVQRIGSRRIAVLVDGMFYYEPAVARPAGERSIVPLVIPDGAIIAGRESRARILFTLPR